MHQIGTGEGLTVRSAELADSAAITELVAQLGYPTGAAEIRARLKRLLRTIDAGALVAQHHRDVVGLATFHVFELLARPRPQCRITALVVRDDSRRHGIGRALVDAVEQTARDRGCFRLELTTRRGRPGALPFYAALGFVERPHRLVKALEGD